MVGEAYVRVDDGLVKIGRGGMHEERAVEARVSIITSVKNLEGVVLVVDREVKRIILSLVANEGLVVGGALREDDSGSGGVSEMEGGFWIPGSDG